MKRNEALPTVQDRARIALAANISVKTVERCLKGRSVQPVVRAAVVRACSELGLSVTIPEAVTQ